MPMDLDYVVDLEKGEGEMTNGEGATSTDSFSDARMTKTFFSKVCGGLVGVDGSAKGENGILLSSNSENSSDVFSEDVKLLIDKKMEGEEAVDISKKKIKKERWESTSAKKPPKPPRPPRGLSLDATDQKLIKEIAEIARIKRAKIERLKKMKAAKASSSTGNLIATMFTILFCLVVIFQGLSSKKSSAVTFQGSLESTSPSESGYMLVPNRRNP